MRPDMQRARGFTLIELIIVTIVIGIMAAVLAPLMLSSLRAYDDTLGDVVVLDKLRYATERLAREIREVNYDSATTSYAFTSSVAAPSNSMTFTRSYYDSSGAITATRTVTVGTTTTSSASCVTAPCVTLAYSDIAGNAAQVLTDELGSAGNLAFSYYQQDGATPATNNVDVRYVQINLTLRHNGNDYPQHTRVELKNN